MTVSVCSQEVTEFSRKYPFYCHKEGISSSSHVFAISAKMSGTKDYEFLYSCCIFMWVSSCSVAHSWYHSMAAAPWYPLSPMCRKHDHTAGVQFIAGAQVCPRQRSKHSMSQPAILAPTLRGENPSLLSVVLPVFSTRLQVSAAPPLVAPLWSGEDCHRIY